MAILKVGDVLEDRYRIDTPIARGGMSTVYRCVDLRLGRSVAVKVMDQAYVNDPVFLQRFRREARSMAQLSHPNLVNVYDFSSSGDHAFLVMELITGGTLRELLAERGPMPPHAAVEVMRGMLRGLAAAHGAGMVHRDIKPDNVLINSDHQVKLSDFGLVRAASAGQSLDNKIVGTVAYLSPEQVEGREIGPESDVYSAGIVLFELLTGVTPFRGDDDMEHAYVRLEQSVPAPSSLIDGVPSLMDALVSTATSMDPGDRFADAGEFLEALEDVAGELNLPGFRVPAPINSAAHRAHAAAPTTQPTDMFTTQLPGLGDETSVIPAAHETSILPPVVPETEMVPRVTPVPDRDAVEVAEPESGESDSGDGGTAPLSNRSGLRLTLWLILVGLIIAAVAVGGWWFGSGRYGEIPQVIGMDEVQAVSMVEDAGYGAVTELRYDNDTSDGAVIGTEPSFGSRLPRGQDVTVLVSQGRPVVPDLDGDRSVAAVRSALENRTLVWVEGPAEYSDDISAGEVVSTSPSPGSTVDVGAHVQVHLSRGPAPVSVPDVSGMDVDQATKALERVGLKVDHTVKAFDAGTREGHVYGTEPSASRQISRGDSVVLKVSNAISVPEVEGMKESDALKTLADAGLTVASTSRNASESAASADTVVGVSPRPGGLIDPAAPQVSLELAGQVDVPNIVGKRIGEARELLDKAGLELDSDAADDERVITQTPRARSHAAVGTAIQVRSI
ncbi:Stk1 family PASTA domain-containing Ser/Thr kinase [Corynebacterium pacaense]|uniref:Stk1 family PASTA domain-containing Ser/Thr kinase n=1 Tax=Corynebacterium pacaense TaxID=1816684 RepID=UPI0009BAED4A|nr:Stk1 family PASTA domain-containing Ser/Thr kinase [Corynebacterium pacaense]